MYAASKMIIFIVENYLEYLLCLSLCFILLFFYIFCSILKFERKIYILKYMKSIFWDNEILGEKNTGYTNSILKNKWH